MINLEINDLEIIGEKIKKIADSLADYKNHVSAYDTKIRLEEENKKLLLDKKYTMIDLTDLITKLKLLLEANRRIDSIPNKIILVRRIKIGKEILSITSNQKKYSMDVSTILDIITNDYNNTNELHRKIVDDVINIFE